MDTQSKSAARRYAGFTIIELVTIIAVIGILLTIGVASFSSSQSRAKKEEAVAVAEKAKLMLNSYFSEKDRYPRTQTALTNYLTLKGDTKSATALGDTTKYVFEGTTGAGGTCADTGFPKCDKYTITVKKAAWQGGASDSDAVVTP